MKNICFVDRKRDNFSKTETSSLFPHTKRFRTSVGQVQSEKMKFLFVVFAVLAEISVIFAQVDLITYREWKKLDFKFPSQAVRDEALASSQWVPENAFPIDVDVDYYSKFIIVYNNLNFSIFALK